MIAEMFLWWLLYAPVVLMSAVALSAAHDSDSWIIGGVIFSVFIVPLNGLYFSALYCNFYLKWFLG